MAELKINISDVDTLVTSIKDANKKIDTSVASVPDPTKCKNIMISAYLDRIKKISDLLEKYRELLERDAIDIAASKDKIEEMDKTITTLY